jgi:hypothetical protein
MIKYTYFAGLTAMTSLLCVSSAVNALTVNFQGNLNIDFSSDPTFGSTIGVQTLTINDTITLPFTAEELANSLGDGDSTVPISFLLSSLFPQEVIPDALVINGVNITEFSGTVSAYSDTEFLTNFDFMFGNIMGEPTLDLSNFNANLSQCVFIACRYTITGGNATLTASFDASLLQSLAPFSSLSSPSITETPIILTVNNAAVTSELSTQSVPESLSWFVVPTVLGGMAVLKRFKTRDV